MHSRVVRVAAVVGAALVAVAFVVPRPPRTVTDQRGKTHTFVEPARRVVTIAIPLFWTFLTVDGTDSRVVGANAVAVAQMNDGIAGHVFRRAAAVTTTITRGGTFTPNVEALLALRPDAVFQWADRGDALVDVLDRAGLRALGVKNTNRESDIESWIGMSGVVSGKESRADSIVRWMRAGNHRFDSLTAGIPSTSRPRVLVLTEYSRTITANGPTSYAATIVERAGGRNVATGDGAVGIEQVLRWDPEVILLTAFEPRSPGDLVADARWSGTSAARTRRVYKLPFGVTRWGGYGPESPLFLEWLGNLVQPDRFQFSFRRDARAAYRTLFNYALTDPDLDRMLQMDENRASAHYAVFARDAARTAR